jgi:hypothetical protein
VSDLGSSNYSETAASNNAMPPNGWPEGMAPSDVNNSARENMAGTKRFWDRINPTATTDVGGTTTAYTLTYPVAATSYYNGELFTFYVDKTCGATPSLNINGLGAFNLRKFSGGSWVTLSAGDIAAGQNLSVAYNSTATTFDIFGQPPQTVWQVLGSLTPSGVSTLDLATGISSSINHLQILYRLQPSQSTTFALQFYGSGGTLDTGSNYYAAWSTVQGSAITGSSNGVATTGIALNSSNLVDSSTVGFAGECTITGIQDSFYTQAVFRSSYQNSGFGNSVTGAGAHAVAARITGVRLIVNPGTFGGRVTLLGCSN